MLTFVNIYPEFKYDILSHETSILSSRLILLTFSMNIQSYATTIKIYLSWVIDLDYSYYILSSYQFSFINTIHSYVTDIFLTLCCPTIHGPLIFGALWTDNQVEQVAIVVAVKAECLRIFKLLFISTDYDTYRQDLTIVYPRANTSIIYDWSFENKRR